MRTSLLMLILAISLAACGGSGSDKGDGGDKAAADTDGDGLTDDEEAALGTDPTLADTDADGLSDLDETEAGSDPTLDDTDGDSYLDSWEVTEGTNPTDAESRIYTGYWPYNPDKDAIPDPGWDGSDAEGELVPRFQWVDQFGDTLDLYDYAYQGKPIVIDVSGAWCYYCKEMAKLLDGQSSYFDDYAAYYDWIEGLPELVDNGDIYWITAIDANSRQQTADEDDVANWYEDYPNPNIAVVLDQDQQFMDWINIVGYPTVFLVNEDMTVASMNRRDYTKVLDDVMDAAAR